MANSTSPVPQVQEGTNAVQKINELFDAGSQTLIGGRNAATTSALTWGYIGGRINGNTVANGTVTLTASTTNYVVMAKSSGTVSTSTSTTNWNDTATYWRLYSVVTGAGAPSSYTDERSSQYGIFGIANGSNLSNPMTTAEDIIKGGATGTPVRVAVGTNGQVLTVVAGAVAWANNAAGFTNPMTTAGDLILGDTGGAAIRLGIGAAGQILTSDGTTAAWGAPSIPQNSQSGAYTLVAADAGKHILHPSSDTTPRTFTIPANASVAFPIGTTVTFVNQNSAGTITIAITSDTMRLAGPGTTGSRSLVANGIATAIKITSTEWIISGTGLT